MSTIAHTGSAEATQVIAARLAALVRAGDLIVLCGDLGAGKTTFTQGFGGALGVKDPITSPTFTIANRYEGALVVNHLDVYRLAHIDEVADLGLAELVDDRSVTLIEWGDAIAGALAGGYLEVRISLGEGPDERTLEFRTVGNDWQGREAALSGLAGDGTGVAGEAGGTPC
jgi:tRNA threonylcarbamoyladenosine biosynthesis protein TsaE